jgi:hypothetical protein
MPPNRTGSSNGSGNLFLEADPDATPPQTNTHPRAGTRRPRRAPPRPGPTAPVGASSQDAAAAAHRPNASAFTRPATRPGLLSGRSREHLQRADANARRLAAQLSARRDRALFALALVGATLLALSWMALALRNAVAERHSAERHAAGAAAALEQERDLAASAIQRDQTRIATPSRQLEESRAAGGQRPAQVTAHATARSPAKRTQGKAHGR